MKGIITTIAVMLIHMAAMAQSFNGEVEKTILEYAVDKDSIVNPRIAWMTIERLPVNMMDTLSVKCKSLLNALNSNIDASDFDYWIAQENYIYTTIAVSAIIMDKLASVKHEVGRYTNMAPFELTRLYCLLGDSDRPSYVFYIEASGKIVTLREWIAWLGDVVDANSFLAKKLTEALPFSRWKELNINKD